MDINITTIVTDNNRYVTDDSSPSSAGSTIGAGSAVPPSKKIKFNCDDYDEFTKVENKLFDTIEYDIADAELEDKGNIDVDKKEDAELDAKLKDDGDEIDEGATNDKVKFFCTRCQKYRPIRMHCFECFTCCRENCKECWPDCKYWPHCARCGGFYCLSCNDYQTYHNDGQYYCDKCWETRIYNEMKGREPSDSSAASSENSYVSVAWSVADSSKNKKP